jgi:hypothetical protein
MSGPASEYLLDEFSIRNDLKQRLALSTLILIFSDVIRNVQKTQNRFEFKTHQLCCAY